MRLGARPLSLPEQHILAVLVGALPALYIGFSIGSVAVETGADGAPASLFGRALICAAHVGLLAALAPRIWLLPSLIYGYGFYSGYLFSDGIAAAVNMFAGIVATIAGEPSTAITVPRRPELPWLLAIAFWVAGSISFIRCRCRRPQATEA